MQDMARELLKLERLSRNTRRAGDVMVKAKNSKQANRNVRHWSCCDCDAGIVLGGSNNCQAAKKSHPLPKDVIDKRMRFEIPSMKAERKMG